MKLLISSSILLVTLGACNANKNVATEIQWQHSLSTTTFEQAEKEGKLIVLTLEANWCHWCHVMENSTYTDTEVIQFINSNFIPVKVDQDANPELAARYRKYGWPATIVLNSKGEDIVKKAGYMSPKVYLTMLQEALDGKSIDKTDELNGKASSKERLKKRLLENFDALLDVDQGGFKSAMSYLEEESMEFALHASDSEADKRWFKTSIQSAYNLCDPEWGGVYQYSTQGDWNHPHYEKLLHIQARYMRLFLQDYAYFGNKTSLENAEKIKEYCDRFLRQKDGLYGNAQDADLIKGEKASAYFALSDKQRMKKGIPAIDANTYTNSNADYARSLLKFYSIRPVKQDSILYQSMLFELLKRKTTKGLYAHASKSKDTDALRDNLAMAQLFVEHVKRFPKDKTIKNELNDLLQSIVVNFQLPNGAFQGFSGDIGLIPDANVEENVPLARVFNWYAAFGGKSDFKKHSEAIVQYLCQIDGSKKFYHEPGISMLLEEIDSEAQSIVSTKEGKNHPLLKKAYVYAPFFSCFIVLEDHPNSEKNELFAGISEPSLFICTSTFCSSPLRTSAAVASFYK